MTDRLTAGLNPDDRQRLLYLTKREIRTTIYDRDAISAALASIDSLTAEVARLKEELKLWKPMTAEEAEKALDEAEAIPISDEEIADIMEKVRDPAFRPSEPEHVKLAAKVRQLQSQLAAVTETENFQRGLAVKAIVRIGALEEELAGKERERGEANAELNQWLQRSADKSEQKDEIVAWAQATLTALNVGDVARESPLHKKLRQVMREYREAIAPAAEGGAK